MLQRSMAALACAAPGVCGMLQRSEVQSRKSGT